MAENCDVQARQMFEVSLVNQIDPNDPRWLPQEITENDSQYAISNIAIKNEPIYHYIMDGSGSTGQYLPVVTIGADGRLTAVTDPTCLPNHPSAVPVDVGEEVIVFPDKTTAPEVIPEDVVEIDVDACTEEVSNTSDALNHDPLDHDALDQQNQIPLVTALRTVADTSSPNKSGSYTIGSIQYLQGTNRTSPKILTTGTPAVRKGKFQCKVCLKTFTQQVNLQTHQRIHTGERPFQCQVCLKSFTQQPNLWKHMRTHTGERPFQCRVCQKSFTQQGNLSKHEKIHTGERPFKCPTCEKTFAQRSNLMTHLTLHTGVRPYRCLVCDKSFAQRANLLTHNMTHTGERPYKCEVCQKGFSQQANLVKHVRLHTGERPYSCRFCSRTFAQQANLDRHERIHTGVKPYACTSCWRAFGQKTNLQKHEATHHQEKAYPCFLCRKAFVAKATLEKHQQKVHAHQMYPNCCAGKAHTKNCGPPANNPVPINKGVQHSGVQKGQQVTVLTLQESGQGGESNVKQELSQEIDQDDTEQDEEQSNMKLVTVDLGGSSRNERIQVVRLVQPGNLSNFIEVHIPHDMQHVIQEQYDDSSQSSSSPAPV